MTGLLVARRIARSGTELPRNSHTSPVRVCSTAASRVMAMPTTLSGMRLWKVLGIAGLVGVAATGVVVARAERKRRAYTPEEIKAKLRERAKAVS
ncbi:hypothetical protein GCM10009687_28480 [Asanoa iriomotensis]|uniref:Uncharacterized protein n=2 Tax=Asanoa TaxID=195964 RepID=A0ABQ4CBR0_9ACTN|nr:hypothetical protein Air01nite_62880 [Asanoa iriomotensis]